MVLPTGMQLQLVNMICAMVPCGVTQPPPQAYIGDNSDPYLNPPLFNNFSTPTTPIPNNNYFSNNYPEVPPNPLNLTRLARNATGLEDLTKSSDIVKGYARRKRVLQYRYRNRKDPLSTSGSSQRKSRMTEVISSRSPKQLSLTQSPLQESLGSLGSNFNFLRSPPTNTIFSALPIIPVLLNNFNNYMKSVNSKSQPETTPLRTGSQDDTGSSSSISTRSNFGTNEGGRTQRQGRNSRKFYDPPPPLVQTRLGGIEGFYMGTMKGRRISAYEGIPYAELPQRFKEPVAKLGWNRTLEAKKAGNVCLQAHPLHFFRVTGDEDCLFLNVYTPQIHQSETPNKKYPVVFFIHGGSFQYGAGSEYGPSYLLDEDVILVTANYRLGPLGFLSTGDSESPGNYGLKDQALALKWVHDHIGGFGGDVNKVTIMGQSAGGVSAHLHLISNKTTNYFRNGVSLSGTSFGFWPIVPRRRIRDLTLQLAKVLNCPRSTTKEVMKCLRSADPQAITAAQMELYEWMPFHPLVLFAPTLESSEDPTSFLTMGPEEAYQAGKVPAKPWIFGQTSQEGHFDIYFLKLMMQTPTIAVNGRKYLPLILDYGRTTNPQERSKATNKILRFYGGSLPLGRGIDINYISDMYTDRYYTSTIRKAIKAHATLNPQGTYAYLFDYKGKYNLGSLFGAQEADWGVAHTEDLFYYFNSSMFHHGLQRNDKEYGLSQIMTDVLANFMKEGKPMHESEEDFQDVPNTSRTKVSFWDPVQDDQDSFNKPLKYLRIRKNIEMIEDPFTNRIKFWDNLGLDKNQYHERLLFDN